MLSRFPTTILDPGSYYWQEVPADASRYMVMRLYKKDSGADRLVSVVVDREAYGVSIAAPINQEFQDKTVSQCMVILETAVLLK